MSASGYIVHGVYDVSVCSMGPLSCKVPQITERMPAFTRPHACPIVECSACGKDFRTPTEQGYLWYAYTNVVTKGQANTTIKAHVKSIQDDYAQLCGDIDTRGDRILSRWCKLDKGSRRQAIIDVLPSLAAKKWAHLNAYFLLRASEAFATRDQYRQAFLLPKLNIDDLVNDPSRLLLLLDLRRTHKPSDWAWTDFEVWQLSLWTALQTWLT